MQKHQHLSHRDICKGLLLFILLISLCGCSPSAKSEQEIVADLQKSPAFISEAVRIDSCEIIKRQTDPDNKCDLVYLTAYVNEDELKCALSYVMQYALYNDGWILENVSRYDDGPWSIGGLPIDRISSDAISSDFYFSDYALEITDCEILNDGDIYMGKEYEKWFEVALTASCSIFDYWATYDVGYQITGDGWICQYAIPNFSNYSPTYSPDINATNTIMDTLELGSGTSAVPYDSYEYIRTETDWGNCAETRYYEATKNWWFGKETYLVSIPLKFSLENGEDSTRWTYNKTAIESTLQSVDWNIEGFWSADDYPCSVGLQIYHISDMESPGIFPVLLRCNAEYYYNSEVLYYCKARNIKATIWQEEPGFYELRIDCPPEESNFLWRGTYLIAAYDTTFYHQGVSWRWGDYSFHEATLEIDNEEKAQIEETTKMVVSIAEKYGFDAATYDPANPIYGIWKGVHHVGIQEVFCFCSDGTVVCAFIQPEITVTTVKYTYDGEYLTFIGGTQPLHGDDIWFLNWEDDNLFSASSSADQDPHWICVSRISL